MDKICKNLNLRIAYTIFWYFWFTRIYWWHSSKLGTIYLLCTELVMGQTNPKYSNFRLLEFNHPDFQTDRMSENSQNR